MIFFIDQKEHGSIELQSFSNRDGGQGQMEDPIKIHRGQKSLVEFPEGGKLFHPLLMLPNFIILDRPFHLFPNQEEEIDLLRRKRSGLRETNIENTLEGDLVIKGDAGKGRTEEIPSLREGSFSLKGEVPPQPIRVFSLRPDGKGIHFHRFFLAQEEGIDPIERP